MDFGKVEIGVNSEAINSYLGKIKADVINSAIIRLNMSQDALFSTFRENWKGQSEANFEANMTQATEEVKTSLENHYNALASKIYAIHNAWITQDEEMVQKQGGAN